MTHTAEPMTLEQTPKSLRALAKIIRKHGTCAPMALEEIADAIDAELAKLDNLENAIFQIAMRLGVARGSEMDDMDYHTDLIARAQFLSELAKQRESYQALFTGTLGGKPVGLHGTKESVEALEAYIAKLREAEPVARVRVTNGGVIWRIHNNASTKSLGIGDHFLYTHPQQRNAVEVTDDMVETVAETFMRVRGLGMLNPWQAMTETTRADYRIAFRAALQSVQPAQGPINAIAQPVSVPKGWKIDDLGDGFVHIESPQGKACNIGFLPSGSPEASELLRSLAIELLLAAPKREDE